LIPAGTGFPCHRDSEFEFTVEEPDPIVQVDEYGDEGGIPEGEEGGMVSA
jgi:hypothetical protein